MVPLKIFPAPSLWVAATDPSTTIMESSRDFKSTQEQVQAALVKATRTSNSIAAEDLNFQRRSNPAAGEALDDATERLLALSTSLLKAATKGSNTTVPELEDADDVDAHWSRIVDVIDTLLEKADTCLDEYTGLVKRKAAPTDETVRPRCDCVCIYAAIQC